MDSEKIKVGLSFKSFEGWGGGRDFVFYLASILANAEHKNRLDITILISEDDYLQRLRRIVHHISHIISNLRRHRKISFGVWGGMSNTKLRQRLTKVCPFTIASVSSHFTAYQRYATKHDFDVLFPCLNAPRKNFSQPWIGYLYDCQHRHYPEFFDPKKLCARDRHFISMLNTAQHIIVNSHAVKSDLQHFYGPSKAKIHVLPFLPIIDRAMLKPNDVLARYNQQKEYFIICNQFWQHKDHETAFKAFALLTERFPNIDLLCTGTVSDPRNANRKSELKTLLEVLNIKKKVKLLGHIPKRDQIALLRHSKCVIQPTLFEGGPGGGAAWEASAYGVPLILSNILVNQEVKSRSHLSFFNPGDHQDLMSKMEEICVKKPLRLTADDIIENDRMNRITCYHFLEDLIEKSII